MDEGTRSRRCAPFAAGTAPTPIWCPPVLDRGAPRAREAVRPALRTVLVPLVGQGPQYGPFGDDAGPARLRSGVLEEFGPRSTQERMEALNALGLYVRSSKLLEPGLGLVLTTSVHDAC